MASTLPTPRATLSAAREAVRLLDAVIGGAAPDPDGTGFAFATSITGPVLDRVTLWLAARMPLPPATGCPVTAAQREAGELLTALMVRVRAIRPLPSGEIAMRFVPGAVLFDRLMVWGSAAEDLEAWGEDDEDGADAEQTDDPLASGWPGPPGAASWCGLGFATGSIVSDLSTYNHLDVLTA